MEEKKTTTGLTRALTTAYHAVMALGIGHQCMVDNYTGVNYNTLSRIRDGKPRKPVTDRFYLRLFVSILNDEYKKRRAKADTHGMTEILRILREILLLEQDIPIE